MNLEMNQPFAESGFTLEITHDGSPTLRHLASGESMHHFDGAAGESWYVYGLPLIQALKISKRKSISEASFKVVSVGLGLGYVEMLWALTLASGQEKTNPLELSVATLDSFEIIESLQKKFLDWIYDRTQPSSFFYDLAFQKLVAASSQLATFNQSANIKKFLCFQIQVKKICFFSDLLKFTGSTKWNFICFDAFSKNTDQSLWTSDYLDHFFKTHSADDCVFATYAATTTLNNVLHRHHFKLLKRLGYSGKRECTLALRGSFTDDTEIFQTF